MEIIVVPFPENDNHMVRPLDIAVSKTFKETPKK